MSWLQDAHGSVEDTLDYLLEGKGDEEELEKTFGWEQDQEFEPSNVSTETRFVLQWMARQTDELFSGLTHFIDDLDEDQKKELKRAIKRHEHKEDGTTVQEY